MNKRGIIKISDQVYKKDWDIIHIIFKKFKPAHIEFRHWENDTWVLYGVCDDFDDIKEGDPVPQYEVIFKRNEHGIYDFTFEKV